MICENGHENEVGGCCCPIHGNTCGFCPEHDQAAPPEGFNTLAEHLISQPARAQAGIGSLKDLAASSPAWEERLVAIKALC